jgi:AcrR family transcriptional regulator
MAHIPAERRKEIFVEAAVAVIAEHGVRGATTRRIADAAGAPLSSLHYCFDAKEDLFDEVFTQIGYVLLPSEDASGKLSASSFLCSAIDWMLGNKSYAIAQVELYLWAIRRDTAEAAKPYEILANALIDGVCATRPNAAKDDVVDIVWLAIAAMDGLVLQWFYQRDDERTRRYARIQGEELDRMLRRRRPVAIR